MVGMGRATLLIPGGVTPLQEVPTCYSAHPRGVTPLHDDQRVGLGPDTPLIPGGSPHYMMTRG